MRDLGGLSIRHWLSGPGGEVDTGTGLQRLPFIAQQFAQFHPEHGRDGGDSFGRGGVVSHEQPTDVRLVGTQSASEFGLCPAAFDAEPVGIFGQFQGNVFIGHAAILPA